MAIAGILAGLGIIIVAGTGGVVFFVNGRDVDAKTLAGFVLILAMGTTGIAAGLRHFLRG